MLNDTTHNPTEIRILEWIHSRMIDGSVSRSFSDIADGTEFSKATVKTAVDKLEQQGLLDVDRDARPFLYEKTGAGQSVLEYLENSGGVSGEQVNKVDGERTVRGGIVPSVNVHDFAVEMPLENNQVMVENRETLLRDFDNLRLEDEELAGEWERFHFRISGEKVIIYLKGEVQSNGLSSVYVKNRALQELERCREWLTENLNLRFRDDVVVEGRVISQDIAVEDHPITQLADRAGIKLTPERFHSTDAEGNVRIKLDLSGGVTGECEASMRGSESSAARLEESDVQALCDDLLMMANNREDWNTLWSYAEDRETIFRALSYLLDSEVKSGMELPVQEGRDGKDSVRQARSLTDELEFSSKWIDNHGNLMGYAVELGRPVKIVGKEDLP